MLEPGSTGGSVRVPFDHDERGSAEFELLFELGAPFDPSKVSVVYFQDGQQFRIREGRVAQVQERFFGPEINLIGVPGRIFTEAVAAGVRSTDGEIDWQKTYQYYRSRQWCGDLDAVRRKVVGDQGQITIYGRSGGALLVQEYLALYGPFVSRAFVQAAPNPKLEQKLELPADPFWDEIGAQDPNLRKLLAEALAAQPDQREDIVNALSRQHFFHTDQELAAERAQFIHALAKRDQAVIAEKLEQYQVNAINRMVASPVGLAMRVRQYEFFQPIRHHHTLSGPRISPTPEMQYRLAKPLLDLHDAGQIPGWDIDLEALGNYPGEIFILAGAHDVAVNPAYQKMLADLFLHSTLFLASDDHMMKNLQDAGLYTDLHMKFLQFGIDSKPMRAALQAAAHFRVPTADSSDPKSPLGN